MAFPPQTVSTLNAPASFHRALGPALAAVRRLCGHSEPRGWVDQEAWPTLGIAFSAGTCEQVFRGSNILQGAREGPQVTQLFHP